MAVKGELFADVNGRDLNLLVEKMSMYLWQEVVRVYEDRE